MQRNSPHLIILIIAGAALMLIALVLGFLSISIFWRDPAMIELSRAAGRMFAGFSATALFGAVVLAGVRAALRDLGTSLGVDPALPPAPGAYASPIAGPPTAQHGPHGQHGQPYPPHVAPPNGHPLG